MSKPESVLAPDELQESRHRARCVAEHIGVMFDAMCAQIDDLELVRQIIITWWQMQLVESTRPQLPSVGQIMREMREAMESNDE